MTTTPPWADLGTTVAPSPTSEMTSPMASVAGRQFDVAVVGAGVTGLTTALLLARAGCSVVVLEARHVGAGTTGRSTAKVSVLQGTHLSRVARRHPAGVVRDYVTANLEGQAWLARFCEDHEVPFQRRAAYTFATSEHGERAARRELEVALAAGLPATWVDEPPLPFATRGAVHLADQLQLDPTELLSALAAEAVRHGAEIVAGARVQRVTDRDPVRVVTPVGDLSAGRVVVATNLPVLDRGGFFARARSHRSYGLAYRTPGPTVAGMFLSADQPTRSLRDAPTEGGALLLVGGHGHRTGASGSEAERLDALRDWTLEHFPDAEETHAWSAQDYVTHHGLPFVGPVLPGQESVLVAGGYSKWGLTNGPAAALALTGRMLGGHMEWAKPLEPWRWHEATGLLDSVRNNTEVGLELAQGWLRPLLRPGRGGGEGAEIEEGTGVVRQDRFGPATATCRVGGVESRVSAVCPHLGGVVRWNDVERSWDCPLHGSRFAPDGEVLEGPATRSLAPR
ncbi:FAD-dependent oxidoreductase [Nocardioides sp. GCM10027113]|uniref:FAD-dependent oxidoreductase n=1 Tax=unclassified Nocardioides TaxID=2615069 RepID=UPI003622CD1E